MPAIFNEKTRAAMNDKMLAVGFDLISEKGFRGITVDEIARRSGIAKGTFYNFFPSKEEFMYQIMLSKRMLIVSILEEMVEEAGGTLDRQGFEKWLQLMWKSDNNLYRQISYEDYYYICSQWPEERSFDPEMDQETSEWVLSKLEGVRKNTNWKMFANIQKVLGLMNLNRKILHADALDDTTDALIKAMCDEMFEE